MTQPISAILWDFGGVLTSSPFEAFNVLEASIGAPKDFIRTINATNPETNAWAQFESSQIGLEEFDVLFAEESQAAGHAIPGRDVIARLSGDLRPRMFNVLKHCKQHQCTQQEGDGQQEQDDCQQIILSPQATKTDTIVDH